MLKLHRRTSNPRKLVEPGSLVDKPKFEESDLKSPRRRGLVLRFLALLLAVGLVTTAVLSDLPRLLLQQDGFAESSDASASLDKIYSILQGSLDNPTTFDDYSQLATISIGKGDYDKAMEELDKCLELADPKNTAALADVWTKKGSLYALKNNYEEAVSCLTKALDTDPKAQQALLLRAQIYIEQRKYDGAIKDLEAYTAILPDEKNPQTTLAQLYEATGGYEKAQGIYEKLYAKDPTDQAQKLNALRCLFLLKKYQDALDGLDAYLGEKATPVAVQTVEPASTVKPDGGSPKAEPTKVPSKEKATAVPKATAMPKENAPAATDEAAKTPSQAAVADSALPAQASYAHYLRALCHMQSSKFDLAEADLLDARTLGYDEAMCLEQLTACEYALTRHDQVLAFGQKLIEMNKSTTAFDVLYQRMGVSAMTLGKTEDAIQYLTTSLGLNEKLAGTHYYRGLCLLTMKKYEEAIKDFTASIDQKFLEQFCYYNRGVCYVQLQDYENALTDMDRTLSSGDDQSLKEAAKKILWQLAQYYENEKQKQAAVQNFAQPADQTGTAADPADQPAPSASPGTSK